MTSVNGIKGGYWLVRRANDFPVERIRSIDFPYYNYLFFGFAALNPTDYTIYLAPEEQILLDLFVQICHDLNIKAILSIGGPGDDAAKLFSEMASNPSDRCIFVQSAIATAKKYNLDGLDLAWEFPTVTGNDMSNLAELLGELRTAINKPLKTKLLLSAAVYYKPVIIVGGWAMKYPVCAINKHLDFVNVICYDYCDGKKCPVTCDDSRLFDNITSRSISTNDGISAWIFAGLDPGKLVLGIPLYGKMWRLTDPSSTEIGSPANYECVMPYQEVKQFIEKASAQVIYHQNVTQYCYARNIWITYDGTLTVPVKVKYAKENHCSGYFLYDIAADDDFEIAAIASNPRGGN